jgi:tetratricopeptide (TPR) repeat protein
MITRNEERTIERAIRSVEKIVDEIVVADTGSVDTTISILKELGAQIKRIEWRDDFASARNVSLEMATGEWIFILDADEEIDSADLELIQGLTLLDEFDGFQFVTRNYSYDSICPEFVVNTPGERGRYDRWSSYPGWIESTKVRLFRNRRKYRFSGAVHELVDEGIVTAGGRISRTGIPVHHAMIMSKKERAEKFEKYKRLAVKKIREDPDSARAYYELADLQANREEWEDAIHNYRRALSIDSAMKEAWVRLGSLLTKLGRFDEAEPVLMKACAHNPCHPEPFNSLGVIAHDRGHYGKSREYLEKAIQLNPHFSQSHFNLSRLYLKTSELERAETHINRAIQIVPDSADFYDTLGTVHYKLMKYEEAREAFQRALQLNPRHTLAWNNLGASLCNLQRYNEGIDAFEKSLSVNPSNSFAMQNIRAAKAKLLQDSARKSDDQGKGSTGPVKNLRAILNGKPGISLCMIVRDEETNLPLCLDSVKGVFDEVIVVDTGSKDRTVETAQRYGARVFSFPWNDSYSDARNESIRKASCQYIMWMDADDRLAPESAAGIRYIPEKDDIAAYYCRLQNLKKNGVSSEARQLRIFPNLPGVGFTGIVHEQVRPSLDALHVPMKDCDVVIHHEGYMDEEVQKRKHMRNLQLLEKAQRNDPHTLGNLYYSGISYKGIGEHTRAIDLFERIVNNPVNLRENRMVFLQSFGLLGLCHEAGGDLAKAIESYEGALEYDADFFFSHFCLGNLYFKSQKWDKAIEHLGKVTSQEIPLTTVSMPIEDIRYYSRLLMGRSCQHTGETEKAIEFFEKAYRLDYRDPNLVVEITGLLALMGRHKEAETRCRRALTRHPLHFRILFALGCSLFMQNRIDDAEVIFRDVAKLAPDYGEAHSNLGKIFLIRNDIEKARAEMERALQLNENLVDLHTHLGDIHFHKGSFDDAISHYRRYLSFNPRSVPTLCRLGSALLSKGCSGEAREAFALALEINPESADASKGFERASAAGISS